MRSLVVNTHPQVAPCGGNTAKDRQNLKITSTESYLKTSKEWFPDSLLFMGIPDTSWRDDEEMRILSSRDAKVEAGLYPRPPPLSSLRTIYIYLCVFTPGNIQTRVYLGYWIQEPQHSPISKLCLDTFFKKIKKHRFSEKKMIIHEDQDDKMTSS